MTNEIITLTETEINEMIQSITKPSILRTTLSLKDHVLETELNSWAVIGQQDHLFTLFDGLVTKK